MTKAIVELNDGIEKNKKKETEIMKEIREITTKVVELEMKIKKRQEDMRISGVELKKDDEDNKKDKKKIKEDDKIIENNNKSKNDKNDKNDEDKKETLKKKETKKIKKK